MESSRKNESWISILGVILLALVLPALLKAANNLLRFTIGAEGRLSAITIETDRTLGPLPAIWKSINLEGQDINQVTGLSPEYIRIENIFEKYDVVKRNQRDLEFNFAKLDNIVDTIASSGAKPFFSLSYMPLAISAGDETSEPINWQEWSTLVEKTISHYSGDKGIEDVYYEVWNEPEKYGEWKNGGKKDYLNLYNYAAQGAEKAAGVSKNFKFGGPATVGLYRTWATEFLDRVNKDDLRLDFISWHRTGTQLKRLEEDISAADKWIETHPKYRYTEKVISGLTIGNSNPAEASGVVTVIREMMFETRYIFTSDQGRGSQQSVAFLNQLGQNRLPISGEGTWVKAIATTNGSKFLTILVNYDPDGKHQETVPVSFTKLPPGKYEINTKVLGATDSTITTATSESMLQTHVLMPANSVALVEVTPTGE